MSVKREFISQICCQIIVNKHTLIKDRKNCYKSFLARKYFNFPLFFCFESPADFKLQRSMTQSTNCISRRALYCQFGQSAPAVRTGKTVFLHRNKKIGSAESRYVNQSYPPGRPGPCPSCQTVIFPFCRNRQAPKKKSKSLLAIQFWSDTGIAIMENSWIY